MIKSTSELFFEAPDLNQIERWLSDQPRYASFTFTSQPETVLHDTYLDTEDWAIYRAGYSLCISQRDQGSVVRLKPNRRHAHEELIQSLDDYTARPGESTGHVSAKVRLLTGAVAPRTLLETETRRRAFLIQQEGVPLAVLNLDETEVRVSGKGGHSLLARAELEEVGPGGLTRLQSVVKAIGVASQLTPTNESKFAAALRATGISPEAAFDFGYAQPTPDASAGEFAHATLRRYFSNFLAHEPGTRLGEDPEELHDMRVAARRLRSAIRIFKPVLPLRFEVLSAELKWIAGALGEVRDLDVRLDWLAQVRAQSSWDEDVAIGPLIDGVRQSRADSRERLLAALSSQRFQDMMAKLATALRTNDTSTAESATPVVDYAGPALRKCFRRFRRAAGDLSPDSDASAYHEVRTSAKRLRYSVECFQSILGRRARRLIDAAKEAQDLLGEYQDSAVTMAWLRDTATVRGTALPPATLVRIGELLVLRQVRMAEIGAEWPVRLKQARQSWSAVRKTLESTSNQAESTRVRAATRRPVAAVQRPFSLLKRFFRSRRRKRP